MKNKIELDPTTKAAVILEALPYVQRFKNSIFVIKYGGAFMDSSNPEKRKQIATDIAFLHTVGIKVIVVHGGGKSITNALSEKNIESKFKNGLRVTSKEIISVVDNVLNQKINLDICENLTEKGAATNALNGKDIFKCKKKKFTDEDNPNKSFDLGFVGEIDEVKTDLIYKSLDAGKIPVISPLASDQNGII